jgi:putative PIN family toxin of toxin-antitoxin system
VRVVVDTNVVVSAMLWKGMPGEVLSLARDGRIRIYASKVLLDELGEVIRRRKFAKQLQRIGRTAAQLMRDYRRLTLRARSRRMRKRFSRDADDDAVLACARVVRAELIVSGDDDLLSLGAFRGSEIVTPRELQRRFSR